MHAAAAFVTADAAFANQIIHSRMGKAYRKAAIQIMFLSGPQKIDLSQEYSAKKGL